MAFGILVITIFFGTAINCQSQNQLSIKTAFPNLVFNQPDGLFFNRETNRFFVTEQAGIIKVFENSENASTATIFLDLRDRVLYGGEQGLLGLAFHPNYAQNGYFYINYMVDNPRRTIIARFTVTADDPYKADKKSELILLEVNQPFPNHNGGQLAFGPDGYLYIGLGDGGSAGDPFGNAQNRLVLLGKILRIDVNSSSENRNYEIPCDNPYANNTLGYRQEIYAYGFRNPWRFSFDPQTGRLWVGDVGQNQREEVDLVEKGKNYGWNIMEGTLCYSPETGCNQTGLELPVWDYGRSEGFAVIGGYIYRGSDIPDLEGAYVYGDYGSGRIWGLRHNGTGTPENKLLVDTALNIASFGLDDDKEIFFSAFDGKIYTFNFIIPEFPWQSIISIILIATLATVLLKKKLTLNSKVSSCKL